jgi:hypothetical protein
MKTSVTEFSPKFTPIQVTLTFEDKVEFDAFYQLTNYSNTVSNSFANRVTVMPDPEVLENVLFSVWQELVKYKRSEE